MARAISSAARDLGLTADPSVLGTLRLVVDALDTSAMVPFWRAALGYEPLGSQDLVDPLRRNPAFRFQQRDQPRPLRNRVHVDVVRPHELAVEGLEAATAAGGQQRFRSEYYATLADAEGNEADIVGLVPIDTLGEAAETADWRVLFAAMALYPTTSPVQAAELTAVAAGLADEAALPLLVDLRPDGVTIDTGKLYDSYRFQDMRFRSYRTIRFECNWKTAVDAFNEGYHPQALHPQMLTWFNDTIISYEQFGEHSGYSVPPERIEEMGTSPRLGLDRDEIDEREVFAERIDAMAGLFAREDQATLRQLRDAGPPEGQTVTHAFNELRIKRCATGATTSRRPARSWCGPTRT